MESAPRSQVSSAEEMMRETVLHLGECLSLGTIPARGQAESENQ